MEHSASARSASPVTLSLGVALVTLVLTVAYHWLEAGRFFGVGFALFLLLLVIGAHVLAALSGTRERNRWAYLFLLPLLCAGLGEVLYASMVVRILAPLVSAVSLVFFTYWFMAPRTTLRQVKSLWHRSLFLESVIPVDGSRGMFSSLGTPRYTMHILIGVAFAFPVLLILLTLFSSADPLFKHFLNTFFIVPSFSDFLLKIIFDILVAFYLGHLAWAMVTRARQSRAPKMGEWNLETHHVTLYTFLSLVNVLFLIFIAFQFVYFFGGMAVIQGYGVTYADYARQGFFQLLFVAGIVFVLAAMLYRMTNMRERYVKALSLVLMAQTGIVIASAVRRLMLYIDAYGLSLSRLWAMFVILLIAAVLVVISAGALARASYGVIAKIVFLGVLFIVSATFVFNIEKYVARYNIERYVSGQAPSVDLQYLSFSLSSDATPTLVDFVTSSAQTSSTYSGSDCMVGVSNGEVFGPKCVKAFLLEKMPSLEERVSKDWRDAVWSDYQALAALAKLK